MGEEVGQEHLDSKKQRKSCSGLLILHVLEKSRKGLVLREVNIAENF